MLTQQCVAVSLPFVKYRAVMIVKHAIVLFDQVGVHYEFAAEYMMVHLELACQLV